MPSRIPIYEATPGSPLITRADDASALIEACLATRGGCALLYPANLPARFFDLSSGEAGAILQKLRQYRIFVAVVASSEIFSSRFGEMEMEERRKGYFGVFETAEEAREWLRHRMESVE